MSLATGAVVRERFEIRGLLGRGGMGNVFRAFDRELGVEVALKSVRIASPQAFYRLKAEFRTLADLRHRNLVRLGELFGGDDDWFFSMELVEGLDFLHWVRGSSRSGRVHETSRHSSPDPLDIDASGERLAFGSTTGSLWATTDGGENWSTLSTHLPPVYAVRFADR